MSSIAQRQLAHMNKMQTLAEKDKQKATVQSTKAAPAKPKAPRSRKPAGASVATASTSAAVDTSYATPSTPSTSTTTSRGAGKKASVATGKHLKLVVDHLRANRQEYSLEQLFTLLNIDPKVADSLEGHLRSNLKILFSTETNTYSYKARYQVGSIDELAALFRRPENRFGIDREDLKDSYIGVDQDLEALKKERMILAVVNMDTKTEILFYNEPQYDLVVDTKLRTLWDAVGKNVKKGSDLIDEMTRAGLKPVETVMWEQDKVYLKRKFDNDKNGKPRKERKIKLTNEHMAHMFDFQSNFNPEAGPGSYSAVTNQHI